VAVSPSARLSPHPRPVGFDRFKLHREAAQGMREGVVEFAGDPVALAADSKVFQVLA
jgi:hypothetical protein